MIGENIRNDIRRMIKNIEPFFGAQHMPHIKGLPTFKPPGIICIDVVTPPMVGPTWLRVRSVLGSDCLPALF